MKIPYPVVTNKNPFFYVTVSGVDLSKIVTTGVTELQVYRVQSNQADAVSMAIHYNPLEAKKNKFTFVFDDNLFNLDGGRYQADFYYLGTLVASLFFQYSKDTSSISGSVNV